MDRSIRSFLKSHKGLLRQNSYSAGINAFSHVHRENLLARISMTFIIGLIKYENRMIIA